MIVIGAMADDRVAGVRRRMPWHAPDDLRRFRDATLGHAVIMGRRTWEGLPAALPGRENIVLAHDAGFAPDGATAAESLQEALASVTAKGPAFVIGGADPWAAALPIADEVRLTRIYGTFEGDVRFPELDTRTWVEIERDIHHGLVDGVRRQMDFITLRSAR